MVNYNQSIIYKLCCRDVDITEIYVGSTTNFYRRKSGHKCACNRNDNKDYNCYVYQFIRENGSWDNWDMVIVEAFSATDKNDLHKRERHWIETLKAKLNKQTPTRTNKEYQQLNSDKIKENNKQYHQLNRDKILNRVKQYQQLHKEQTKQHKQTYREKNKDKLLEQSRQYRLLNKEAIKANRLLNRDTINEKKRQQYQLKKQQLKEQELANVIN